jgi:hypothetical protein
MTSTTARTMKRTTARITPAWIMTRTNAKIMTKITTRRIMTRTITRRMIKIMVIGGK